jgi:excisionase family DNA binding protein
MVNIMVDIVAHGSIMPQRMLTVKEVASILNVHSSTVRRWESEGLLKSCRIGRRHIIRFNQEDVLDFLNESRGKASMLHDQDLGLKA